MKELQIVAPEGYEVDKEKSTFEKIIFKEKVKSEKPKDWYEFCNNTPVNEEYYIDDGSIVQTYTNENRSIYERNLCKTYEEAEAFLALIQLRRLWWEWNDGLRPKSFGCYIDYDYKTKIWRPNYIVRVGFPFWFKDEETAELFLEAFKGLFDKVKVLYQ